MSCCRNKREYGSEGRRDNDAYDGYKSNREFGALRGEQDAFERLGSDKGNRCKRCNNRCNGILCNICRCFFNCGC